MKSGLNMQYIKNENRSTILYLLNRKGMLSRKEIAETTGLTAAAVTKICSKLIEEGYIKESGGVYKGDRKTGRKEILLSLCLEDKMILGINAETNNITYSDSKMNGENLYQKVTDFTADPDKIVKEAVDFLAENNLDASLLSGIGVCHVGSFTNSQYGLWDCNSLKEKLISKFSLPVIFENNVKAFAVAELIFEGNSNESVIFLKWGPGIGSALAREGRVYSGTDNGITEIGHYITNRSGIKCRCGRYGCLETETGEKAILDAFDNKMTLEEIINSKSKQVGHVIDQKIDMVALALTNTATIVDADKIILFGSIFKNETIAQKLTKQSIRYNSNMDADMIKIAKFNSKIGYIGPVGICAEALFFEPGSDIF